MLENLVIQTSLFEPWFLLICILGLVSTIIFICFVYKYKTTHNHDYKQEELKNNIQVWFNNKIEKYKEKVLSYQINKICIKKDVPTIVVDKLREQYNNEVVCPTLNILTEFSDIFHCKLSVLDQFYKSWLDREKVSYSNSQNYERMVTKEITKKTEIEAEKIVEKAINNKEI